MNVSIYSLATANPPRYATQGEVYDFMLKHFSLGAAERDLYKRILLEGPIRGRHVGVAYDEQAAEEDPDLLNKRFRVFATATAADAGAKALERAGVSPAEVAALVVSTCTGYLCPGLSSYIAEKLRLPPHVKAFDLAGMGCGAALPNLDFAASLVGNGLQPVLSVAVEICSATIFVAPDADLVVSNSIFGDGAAAAVVGPERAVAESPLRLLGFESLLLPRHREALRYRMQNGRLRNTLSRRVPVLAGRSVKRVVHRLLASRGLAVQDVPWWIVHPGGTSVLQQVARQLNLPDEALRYSHEIFAEYGNMSSPSVLFVLERTLRQGCPRAGDLGVLAAFGAGFSAYAALVEFGNCSS